MCAAIGSGRSARAFPQNWGEHTIGPVFSVGTLPQDCSVSPDNRRGAVRYANPASNAAVVAVWDLTGAWGSAAPTGVLGGGSLRAGYPTALGGFTPYRRSDCIELSNEWGVSIGSGESVAGSGVLDETYIEVFTIAGATPSLVANYTIPSTSGEDPAGFAHDLAITRSAEWAVVNSQNWIQVLALSSPPPAVAKVDFNIGTMDYSTNPPTQWTIPNPCNPDGAVDSVAVTNSRAVVTTKRLTTLPAPGGGTFMTFVTWVYIIDLTAPGGPAIVLQHELLPPPTWEPVGEADSEHPHDVAITPTRDGGGKLAVVTTNHAVACYDLGTNTFVMSHFDEFDRRGYQKQVDSVELSGNSALVIADRQVAGTTTWGVKLFLLSGSGLTLLREDRDESNPTGGSHAHDLALDWDFDKGLVRTSFSNVVVPSLVSATPATVVVGSQNGSDAFAYEAYRASTGWEVFSSDSVAIGSEQNGVLMAATIGGLDPLPSGIFQGQVDRIDLLAALPALAPFVTIAPSANTDGGCLPLDLAISFLQSEVVVRSAERAPQASSTPGPDLVRIALATGALVQSYGGNGVLMGLDSLGTQAYNGFVNTNRKILSISEDPITLLDYVHVAK